MNIAKIAVFACILLVSGCATTNQIVLHGQPIKLLLCVDYQLDGKQLICRDGAGEIVAEIEKRDYAAIYIFSADQ